MHKVPLFRFVIALIAALAASVPALAQSPDTVLVSNSLAKVTYSDYQAELLRLPAAIREGFPNNPKRVHDLLVRMLVQKSLAAQAVNDKLESRPEYAKRIQLEVERIYAAVELDAIETVASAEFDANIARYEPRAREMYLIEKSKFTTPPQVSASHILIDSKKHSPEEAKRLAVEARAKLVAGADMAKLADQISDDAGSAQNGGELGWFAQKDMDPAFGAAAFALAKPGDISEPVQSQFGWHVIKLNDKRPAAVKTYEEARESIMAELRRRYVEQKREEAVVAIRRDPKTDVNRDAVVALTPKVDPETVRRAIEAATQVPPAPAAAPK